VLKKINNNSRPFWNDFYIDIEQKIGQIKLTAKQVASAVSRLHNVVRSYKNLASSRIVGPDVGGVYGAASIAAIKAVASQAGLFLRAITVHHYYFNGQTAKYEQYLDPKHFDSLVSYIGN